MVIAVLEGLREQEEVVGAGREIIVGTQKRKIGSKSYVGNMAASSKSEKQSLIPVP